MQVDETLKVIIKMPSKLLYNSSHATSSLPETETVLNK